MTEMAVETLDQMLNRMCETLREADRDDKSDAATNWNHHCKYATDQLVDADAADREEAAARLGMKATVARLRCLCDCTDSTRRRLLAPYLAAWIGHVQTMDATASTGNGKAGGGRGLARLARSRTRARVRASPRTEVQN